VAKITSLRNRQRVPAAVNEVRGTFENLPLGQEVWLVLTRRGVARFYPQFGPVLLQPDGTWASSSVYVGSDEDIDKKFNLLVVLADQRAGRYFARYLERGRFTGHYPGLLRLPAGAVENDRITIVRR